MAHISIFPMCCRDLIYAISDAIGIKTEIFDYDGFADSH